MDNITVVGIAGGTGSGKTTFAQAVAERLGNKVTLIAHDNYYRAHDELIYDQRVVLNYDHPDAYEQMSKAVNPYGDGKACGRIVNALKLALIKRES